MSDKLLRGDRMYSIGGYNLRKFREFQGRDFPAYEGFLYKGNTELAYLRDNGDGGSVDIQFSRNSDEATKSAIDSVLTNMQNLLQRLNPILHKGAMWETFLATPYSAVEGFVQLLLELGEVVKQAKTASKKTDANCYYAVGMLGCSWFTEDQGHGTMSFSNFGNFKSYEVCRIYALNYAEKQRSKVGPIMALAILQGSMDWNLSFEDYASLYTP
jgi:hypothetical protein